MIITVGKEFHFDAAHRLPDHRGQCKFMHGHTYTMTVELTGEVNEETGMLVDFYDLKKVVEVIVEKADHDDLNKQFPRTTVEFLCVEFAKIIYAAFPNTNVTIQLREGLGGYARYTIYHPYSPPARGEK